MFRIHIEVWFALKFNYQMMSINKRRKSAKVVKFPSLNWLAGGWSTSCPFIQIPQKARQVGSCLNLANLDGAASLMQKSKSKPISQIWKKEMVFPQMKLLNDFH